MSNVLEFSPTHFPSSLHKYGKYIGIFAHSFSILSPQVWAIYWNFRPLIFHLLSTNMGNILEFSPTNFPSSLHKYGKYIGIFAHSFSILSPQIWAKYWNFRPHIFHSLSTSMNNILEFSRSIWPITVRTFPVHS